MEGKGISKPKEKEGEKKEGEKERESYGVYRAVVIDQQQGGHVPSKSKGAYRRRLHGAYRSAGKNFLLVAKALPPRYRKLRYKLRDLARLRPRESPSGTGNVLGKRMRNCGGG